jgi:hypothetical protein
MLLFVACAAGFSLSVLDWQQECIQAAAAKVGTASDVLALQCTS